MNADDALRSFFYGASTEIILLSSCLALFSRGAVKLAVNNV